MGNQWRIRTRCEVFGAAKGEKLVQEFSTLFFHCSAKSSPTKGRNKKRKFSRSSIFNAGTTVTMTDFLLLQLPERSIFVEIDTNIFTHTWLRLFKNINYKQIKISIKIINKKILVTVYRNNFTTVSDSFTIVLDSFDSYLSRTKKNMPVSLWENVNFYLDRCRSIHFNYHHLNFNDFSFEHIDYLYLYLYLSKINGSNVKMAI